MKNQSTRVKRITVSNLKAIAEMEADLNGATVIITGGNNMGKSSFLRSLPDRIRGVKPDVVLKFGEREGFAEWELTTGEKFIWKFDQTGHERLQFITTDDIKQSVTKEIAQRYFPQIFDVDDFLSAGPKKQKEILQKLVGLDFTDIDKRYKAAYDERTFKNRKATEERARATDIIDLPAREIDYIELEKELVGIDSHNKNYSNAQDRMVELRTELEELKKKELILLERIKAGDQWISDKANHPKNNADELTKKIAKIKKQNEAIKKNNEAKKQEKLAIQCELEHKEADKYVKKIEQERMDMISNAKIPEGFSFSEDGIQCKNLPFTREQLSSSGIYIAALKLASMNLGEVRTLHFDASFLDNNSLSEIEKWATKNKLQLLIEVVDRDGNEVTYELSEN
jgi:hypothetical protein